MVEWLYNTIANMADFIVSPRKVCLYEQDQTQEMLSYEALNWALV
jgi:hypothetical protein